VRLRLRFISGWRDRNFISVTFRIFVTSMYRCVNCFVRINWTIKERVSECRRADKVDAHSLVTLTGQTQREQTSKPEVTFVRIAWESEAELVDELENCLHPRCPVQRNCRKIIWDGMINTSRLTLRFLIVFVKDFSSWAITYPIRPVLILSNYD